MDDITPRLAELMNTPLIRALLDSTSAPLYLVGGSVRDLFLGRPLHDLDVVALHDLRGVAFKTAAALGVRAVPMGREPLQIYRIPHQDLFIDLCPPSGPDMPADLARRDLTINAMAVRLTREKDACEIIDPFDGRADLARKTVRFISEANVLADPLRLLRLFRFMTVLNFEADPASLDLVQKHAGLITQSAGERLREELLYLLNTGRAHVSLVAMFKHGLLEVLIPELVPLNGCAQGIHHHHLDVLGHTMLAIECLEDILAAPRQILPDLADRIQDYAGRNATTALMKLALLLHDTGKPDTRSGDEKGLVHFNGHEKISVEIASQVCKRLRLSGAETDLVVFFVRNHMKIFHLFDSHLSGHLTDRGIFRLGRLAGENLVGLALHHLADAWATRGPAQVERGGFPVIRDFIADILERIYRQRATLKQIPKIISGNDLMESFDLPQSPLIGRLIAAIEEAQATGRITGREEALELAGKLVREEKNRI